MWFSNIVLPITCWYLRTEAGNLKYNHFEGGHLTEPVPQYGTPEQKKAWSGRKWESIHKWLINKMDGSPAKIVELNDCEVLNDSNDN